MPADGRIDALLVDWDEIELSQFDLDDPLYITEGKLRAAMAGMLQCMAKEGGTVYVALKPCVVEAVNIVMSIMRCNA